MPKKKKDKIIDVWDIIISILFFGSMWIIYKTPTWIEPTQFELFIMTLADKSFGYLLFGLVIKKIMDEAQR